MRKIERQMNFAISNKGNWSSSNTQVTYNESYPFATGYSKSAMRETQEDLRRVIEKIGAEDD